MRVARSKMLLNSFVMGMRRPNHNELEITVFDPAGYANRMMPTDKRHSSLTNADSPLRGMTNLFSKKTILKKLSKTIKNAKRVRTYDV